MTVSHKNRITPTRGWFVRLGQSQNLTKLVEYSQDSIVSKTILDKPVGNLTAFAFDKGQRLSEHTSPYDATVQVLDGTALITIAGENINVESGEIIVMPCNVPHSVKADEKFKMLLIMIKE